jgi:hypothetical protein
MTVADDSGDAGPTLLDRLTASDDELEAESLRRSGERCGASASGRCAPGQRVELYGRIRAVQHNPKVGDTSPTLEAELFDGTGSVTLIWLGRSIIPGLLAGTHLRVRGRVAVRQDRKVIFNPYYTLEAGTQ